MSEEKNDQQVPPVDSDDEWDDWDKEDDEDDELGRSRMGFLDHLNELRSRLFRIIIALFIGVIVTFNFADYFWGVVQQPAQRMLKTAQERSLAMVREGQDVTIELPKFDDLSDSVEDPAVREEMEEILEDWRDDANEKLNFQLKEIFRSKDARLMQTSITEAFFLKIKLSFILAIILCYPFIMYQVWAFIAPGLYKHERRLAFPFIFFTTLFFVLGILFAYYVAVPFAGTFLMAFGSEFVQMITIQKYMDFLTTMMLGLGIVFEIPMLIFILSKLGVVTPKFLLKHFRYAVLIIVVVAAIITPTGDPINLAIFSLPMVLLYLLGIGIAAIWGGRRHPDDDEWGDDDWDDEDDDDDDDPDDDPGPGEDDGTGEADKTAASDTDPYDEYYRDSGETEPAGTPEDERKPDKDG